MKRGAVTSALSPSGGRAAMVTQKRSRSIGSFISATWLAQAVAELRDQVLEDRQQQLVLAGEVPVEGLQRDAGFLHELLRREGRPLRREEAAGGEHDGLRLLHPTVP